MTRTATALLAAGLFAGCGGENASAPKAASPTVKPETAAAEVVQSTVTAPLPSKAASKKADDEPPGLDLPEDVEAVGTKAPELPIR